VHFSSKSGPNFSDGLTPPPAATWGGVSNTLPLAQIPVKMAGSLPIWQFTGKLQKISLHNSAYGIIIHESGFPQAGV
jgi:hypothetical protein